MSEQTEQETLIGWRAQFATFHRLFRRVPTAMLEKATVALIMLLSLMLPVEMIVRIFSDVGIYARSQGILGVCIGITAFCWIGKRVLVPEAFDRPQWTLCDKALLAMLVWSVLSTVFSPDPAACIRGAPYRNEGLKTYLIYASLYLSLRQLPRGAHTLRIVKTLVIAVMVMCIASTIALSDLSIWLSKVLNVRRVLIIRFGLNNAFYNKNHFSYILAMAAVLSGGLYVIESRRRMKALFMAAYILNVHVMVQNGSLGGYLAAGIGIVAYLVVALIRKDLQPRRVAQLAILFVAVSLVSSQMGRNIVSEIQVEVDGIKNPEESGAAYTGRLKMWTEALAYIAQRPVLGFGPDGSGMVTFPFVHVVHDRPHNEYLQYAIFLGIPGAAMYLTALCNLLIRLLKNFRKLSPLSVVMACMVLAYCASAFVGNSMYYTTIYFVAILAMLVSGSAGAYPETPEKSVR